MASKSPAPSSSGPFAKYVGHKVIMRRNGALIKAVPQDEHSTTNAFGTDFPRGYWVSVSHLLPEYQEKLKTNPGFKFADTPADNEPVLALEDIYIGPIHGSGQEQNIPEFDDEGDFMRSASAGDVMTLDD